MHKLLQAYLSYFQLYNQSHQYRIQTMDPYENGYLARHLQNPFYFNYYNPTTFPQFGYTYNQQPQFIVPQSSVFTSDQPNNVSQGPIQIGSMPNEKSTMVPKKKRLIKRLDVVDMRVKIRKTSKMTKTLRKSLSYFDPSRAPPITTLKNDFELQLDLNDHLKNLLDPKADAVFSLSEYQKTLIKLQILTQYPEQKNYPFLICKRRKYYRDLKRRYSVSYFQQRAFYIQNKIPIPQELEPKYKNGKNRSIIKSQNNEQDSQSLLQSSPEQNISSQLCNPSAKNMKFQIKKIPDVKRKVSIFKKQY